MTKNEFDHRSATLCARMAGSSDRATRQQAARDAATLLADLPAVLRNSPHCAAEIDALRTLIARVEAEGFPQLACIRDGDWIQITDGELDVRVDFTHREKPVEYRFLGLDDDDPRSQWTGTPFQGAEFGLDADGAWRQVSAWLENS